MPGILPAGAVLLRVLPLALLVTGSGATQADTWLPLQQQDDGFDRVRTALRADIERRVFPGCVALVGVNGTLLFEEAFGNHVYMSDPDPPAGPNAPVSEDARFDLASLTKVIATTTAVMQLYQRGFLELNEPVWKTLGSGYATHGKELILIRNLLLHNAGLPPDPVPNFWDPRLRVPRDARPAGAARGFQLPGANLRGSARADADQPGGWKVSLQRPVDDHDDVRGRGKGEGAWLGGAA